MKILNENEAKAFLTKQDLQKLESAIAAEELIADLVKGIVIVEVRKQFVPLFVILKLVDEL